MAARATWVWDRPDPNDLLAWVRAREVQEVFIGVGAQPAPDDRAWLRTTVELMRGVGIWVAALGGDVSWLHNPSAALAWQRAVEETAPFDGVHLDVEVWDRDDWPNVPAADVAAYLSLLRTLAGTCSMHLEVDIAFHLHLVPTASGESLEAAVMRVVDAVTVLSFRNKVTGPDSILDVSASARDQAQTLSVPCRLAVETRYLGNDDASRKQTFHGMGQAALQRAMTQVDTLLDPVSSYRGIAVHEYTSWRAL